MIFSFRASEYPMISIRNASLASVLAQELAKHPGSTPVYLEFKDEANGTRSQMLVDRSLFVQPCETLIWTLQDLLGDEGITLGI